MSIKLLTLILAGLVFTLFSCQESPKAAPPREVGKPTISFTFDDGVTHDQPNYPFEEWNDMILNSLAEAKVKAVFFVTGSNKRNEKGTYLLESWSQQGHKIGNHTFSHPNFNSEKVSLAQFQEEVLQTDSIIQDYAEYTRLFRFPYLKEGNTEEKVAGFRHFLDSIEYKNGYVTIDASDWYIDSRLKKRLRDNPQADIRGFQDYYLSHIYERAQFYEELSFQLTGRHIPHTLLLHHNLSSALFLDNLTEMFVSKGWELVDASEAFTDSIYASQPNVIPAGESLIWSLAKESGKFEHLLRYPAEDSRYEADKMDQLGL